MQRSTSCNFFEDGFTNMLCDAIKMTCSSQLSNIVQSDYVCERVLPFAMCVFLTNVVPATLSRPSGGHKSQLNSSHSETQLAVSESRWLDVILDCIVIH